MMLSELREKLESIDGFKNKVAYRSFPENEAPDLPYICFLAKGSNNMFADNISYVKGMEVDIELYSRLKDELSEKKIEDMLDYNMIPYTKDEVYIPTEKCYEIIYSVEV